MDKYAQAGDDGSWAPRDEGILAISEAKFALHIPRGSAVLAQIDS